MFWKRNQITFEQEMDLAVEHIMSFEFRSLKREGIPQHIGWDELGRCLIWEARQKAAE
jgi:hypothetical protein